ncbi:MAG: Rieske (2Fe-2S) protein [Acidobacteria bacterium]|nr:Rieske (2Fe-2S) protein [Acidobacteriota bacterium]
MHRGTVQDGLLTCHWHHARFDLASGCTFDQWADDAVAFDVIVDGGEVRVGARSAGSSVERLERRLVEGLEGGLTLVVAKAVHGLLAREALPSRIVEIGMRFAAANRAEGWGPGMTVAQVVLNLLPYVPFEEHGRALTQGLAFLGSDSQGHRPRFPIAGLEGEPDDEQLARWYRRFVENRLGQAAERVAATGSRLRPDATERWMFAAATDHVFLDGGHVIDYLNKACETAATLGGDTASVLFPTVVAGMASATRHEEVSEWREPIDLIPLMDATYAEIASSMNGAGIPDTDLGAVGWSLLADDPADVFAALADAARRGATPEQLGRVVAYAAALRLARFHVQNDVGDWDTVHHTFTTANAVHQAMARQPTVELLRGVVHGAARVYLDRFLNIPAARIPDPEPHHLDELEECWDGRGGVDSAGRVVAGYLAAGGDGDIVIGELCRALFREDAGFHWFQSVDAAAAQHRAWPPGSPEAAHILLGATRWLAAHTPTVRQTDQVVTITRRLLRGEPVYEESVNQ